MSDDLVDFSYDPSNRQAPTGRKASSVPKRVIPGYQDIVSGASVLKLVAIVYLFFSLLVALVMGIAGFHAFFQGGQSQQLSGIYLMVGAAVDACLSYAIYAVMRLFPACALALRDIAKNSWRS